jgi:GTP cyclohydrolase IA
MYNREAGNAEIQKRHSLNKKRIEKLIRQLLIEIGENPNREGLIDTPRRMSEMYEEIFSGYRMDSQLDVAFSEESDAIIAKDIHFYSICEHHMLPFFGKITVAYVPSGKVFGLSKLARLVEKYSRRLQIQERLTREIANEIMNMGVKGVLVIAEGEHLCMKMRGVRNGSLIMTMAYRGVLQQKEFRENLLSLIYTPKAELRSV